MKLPFAARVLTLFSARWHTGVAGRKTQYISRGSANYRRIPHFSTCGSVPRENERRIRRDLNYHGGKLPKARRKLTE